MTTTRLILRRERRHAVTSFPPDVVREFVRLDHMRRGCADFKRGERALMRRLGLVDQFWSMNSVLDKSRSPCHPPEYQATQDWIRCRAIRHELLAAAKRLGLGDR